MKKLLVPLLAGLGLVGMFYAASAKAAPVAGPRKGRELTPEEVAAIPGFVQMMTTVLPGIHNQVDATGATVAEVVEHDGRQYIVEVDTDGAAGVFEVA